MYAAGRLNTIEIRVLGLTVPYVVMSLPPEKIIRSVVKRCASEWYRLGIELGFNDSDIQAMTFNIPTSAGKLQVIVERKSMEHGKRTVAEALLDVCEQILPLATVAVMEDLGIQYTAAGTVKQCLLFVGPLPYSVYNVYVLCT